MTGHDTPRVAVVILNWRGSDDTLACLRSVVALDYPALDIVVCDNDSSDGSFERFVAEVPAIAAEASVRRAETGRAPFHVEIFTPAERTVPRMQPAAECRISVVQTGHNGGYAAGNNVGITLALGNSDARYVWILNNDTLVDPAALTQLVSKCEADPTIGICGSLVFYQHRPTVVQTLGGGIFRRSRARCEQLGTGLDRSAVPSEAQVEATLAYVNGAAALVSRAMVERIGLMDEGYFLFFEEIDWAEMAQRAGFRLGFCAQAIVYHKVGGSAGTNDDHGPSPFSIYYQERSKFRFLRRRHSWVLLVAVPVLIKAVVLHVRRGQPDHARAMLRGALNLPVAEQPRPAPVELQPAGAER